MILGLAALPRLLIRLFDVQVACDGDGERLFVRVGGNATLACPDLPPGAGPPRHLLWWKEDRRLIEATRDRVTVAPDAGPRVSLLPGSSALVFRSVLAQDSGEYQCVVNNRQGRRGLVRLFVQGGDDLDNTLARGSLRCAEWLAGKQ
ncbi:conserved hypothetical protein [Ixodes scapularis]|uniref:Ig-like domain-containing protein n=1 Tax=Ixodes scapularis TaxID=6945 RepID=B7PAS4_IXOSC|nr:conserved hypothetical protein [Ixodes scapularis]|eukprot:XP_002407140.1 conserved hypothetical protein [Ixodes scapularis]